MNSKVLTAVIIGVVFVIAGLLAIVIIVGLAQEKLDPTGIAVALTSTLSGIVIGIALREKGKSP